ncbi:MAG: hypothetical protein GY906_19225 [bacterium]|nr:hypothetical protein [bacterium]
MPMSAKNFYARFVAMQKYIKAEPDAPVELRDAAGQVGAALKGSYTSEAFKQALADDAEIDSELEERLTSALILMNQHRTKSGAG